MLTWSFKMIILVKTMYFYALRFSGTDSKIRLGDITISLYGFSPFFWLALEQIAMHCEIFYETLLLDCDWLGIAHNILLLACDKQDYHYHQSI